jgi:hypothetical protein
LDRKAALPRLIAYGAGRVRVLEKRDQRAIIETSKPRGIALHDRIILGKEGPRPLERAADDITRESGLYSSVG